MHLTAFFFPSLWPCFSGPFFSPLKSDLYQHLCWVIFTGPPLWKTRKRKNSPAPLKERDSSVRRQILSVTMAPSLEWLLCRCLLLSSVRDWWERLLWEESNQAFQWAKLERGDWADRLKLTVRKWWCVCMVGVRLQSTRHKYVRDAYWQSRFAP